MKLNFDELKEEFNSLIDKIPGSGDANSQTEDGIKFRKHWQPKITQLIESYLGKNKKISQCTANQVEALSLIVDDLKDLLDKELTPVVTEDKINTPKKEPE